MASWGREIKVLKQLISNFFISSLISSFIILLIIGAKYLLRKRINVRWQSNIGLLGLIIMILPFLPSRIVSFHHLFSYLKYFMNTNGNVKSSMSYISNHINSINYESSFIKDFSVSVQYKNDIKFSTIVLIIWIIGIMVVTFLTLVASKEARKIKKSISLIPECELKESFIRYKNKICIKKEVMLVESNRIPTPLVFGFIKTYIVIPSKHLRLFSNKDLEYVIQHELHHIKNNDILINYIICGFRILYWFNPVIHIILNVIKNDREMLCDACVLMYLKQEKHIEYGHTIINFAENVSKLNISPLIAKIGGTKKHLLKRIDNIAKCSKQRVRNKSGIIVFMIFLVMILSQAPSISVLSFENDKYILSDNGVVYDDLSKYFHNYDGSFVLYDLGNEQFTIFNKELSLSRVSPDSTYKIYSALIAMDQGVIEDDIGYQKWNGIKYPYEEWNHNQNLMSAMHNSVSWYFQSLDKEVGLKGLKNYYQHMKYGNCDISGGIDYYWMESSLKISPVEQVELLKEFYTYNIGFKNSDIDKIKNIIKIKEFDDSILFGKTGTGNVNGHNLHGWFIGYVENKDNTYIFATYIKSKENALGSTALNITKTILQDKNIIR